MIGTDFEKIQFVLFGLNLVEPMAIILDTLLAVVSIYLGYKIGLIKSNHPFYTYWKWFFLIFGIASFFGGLGHTFLNYWGMGGKFPAWICGPFAIYCLEQGMIAAEPNEKRLSLYKLLSAIKLLIVYVVFVIICSKQTIGLNIKLPFLPIAINTIIGILLSAGLLGLIYKKKLSKDFKYITLGVLVLIPTAFIFLMKINLHQWFDKNDLSHILQLIGIIYFYIGIKKIAESKLLTTV